MCPLIFYFYKGRRLRYSLSFCWVSILINLESIPCKVFNPILWSIELRSTESCHCKFRIIFKIILQVIGINDQFCPCKSCNSIHTINVSKLNSFVRPISVLCYPEIFCFISTSPPESHIICCFSLKNLFPFSFPSCCANSLSDCIIPP